MIKNKKRYFCLPKNLQDGRYESILKVKNGKVWLIVYEPKEKEESL